MGFSFYTASKPPTPSGGWISGLVLGGTGGVKIGTVFLKKTRVGFGRTELSLRLSCTEFHALSSGHGPRGQGFEGFSKTFDFHDFFGGSKMQQKKNMKMQDDHGLISISRALDPRKMIS